MGKKLNKLRRAFTLVELIIVIAIVAILSVAAFLVVTKWIGKSRDSRRLSDAGAMKRALEVTLSDLDYQKVPMPSAPEGGEVLSGTVNGVEFAYSGEFGKDTITNLENMQKAPQDPTTQDYYGYGVDVKRKKYQVAVVLEKSEEAMNYLGDQTYALDLVSVVQGNFGSNDLFKFEDTSNTLVALPGLIFNGSTNPVELTGAQFVTDNGKNLPYSTDGASWTEDAKTSLQRVTGNAGITATFVQLDSGDNDAAVQSKLESIAGSANDVETIVKVVQANGGDDVFDGVTNLDSVITAAETTVKSTEGSFDPEKAGHKCIYDVSQCTKITQATAGGLMLGFSSEDTYSELEANPSYPNEGDYTGQTISEGDKISAEMWRWAVTQVNSN